MGNYNSGYFYNKEFMDDGLVYNGAEPIILINLTETLHVVDKLGKLLVSYILADNKFAFVETVAQAAFFETAEVFNAQDSADITALFELTDRLEITDIIENLLVEAYLQEDCIIIDQAKQLAEIVVSDNFDANESIDVEAFIEMLQQFELDDLRASIEAAQFLNDKINITDRSPQKSDSDFIIGDFADKDQAYDWFIPFNMKVDWGTSTIQVMPEAELTSIEMPGIDGSIIENTVYKDRLFQIVAYSEQGMSSAEKEDLKREITKVLDLTKKQSRKLTIQSRRVTFDIKYDGAANIVEGPSYVKMLAPFRTPPYGYDMFDNELYNGGMIENIGAIEIGVTHIITGPISSPQFTLGDITYQYNGNIGENEQLVINHEEYTCYLVDAFGTKTNTLADLSGEFQKVPKGGSLILTINNNLKGHIKTVWKNKRLW